MSTPAIGKTRIDDERLTPGALRPLRAHQRPFRKEKDIQLAAFDAAPPEVTTAVLERMETLSGHAYGSPLRRSAQTSPSRPAWLFRIGDDAAGM